MVDYLYQLSNKYRILYTKIPEPLFEHCIDELFVVRSRWIGKFVRIGGSQFRIVILDKTLEFDVQCPCTKQFKLRYEILNHR
ncbi:hypothetical protein C443_00612 [Haloarcula argentinensis DSM 12282]|nr:hypothetical protein C443_00612 [Haloarcula argentinensis DSM 12282]